MSTWESPSTEATTKKVFASMQRFAGSLHEISAVNLSIQIIRINSERGKGPPAEDAASGKATRLGPTRPLDIKTSQQRHDNFLTWYEHDMNMT